MANDRVALEEIQRLMNATPPQRPAPAPFYIHDGRPIHLTNLYRDATVFLINGGPSFGELDHSLLRQPGILTMAVNNAARTFRPNLWTHVDVPENFIRSIFFDPTILKFSPMNHHRRRIFNSDAWDWTDRDLRQCPNVLFYKRNWNFDARSFLSTPTLNWGIDKAKGGPVSCMLPAIRILYELGVRTIYLLGADFSMQPESKGSAYHFQETKDERAARSNNGVYPKLNKLFIQLRPVLEDAGMRIFNCNPTSGLTAFDHFSYERAIAAALEAFGNIDVSRERTAGLYHSHPGNKPPLDVVRIQRPAAPQPENHHMHIEARKFVEPIARSLGHVGRVLEIGSYNVNGSIRNVFDCDEFVGLDRLSGPGVDVVSEARDFDGAGGFDVVVSMEAMEHAEHPLDIIRCAMKALKPRGTFIVTAAAEPRKPHGADGRSVKPGEHYGNINPGWLRERLQLAGFETEQVEWDDRHGDVYAVAKKVWKVFDMLTAITLTGDRPEAFALCERWMRAQTRQPDRWIVVDDGHVPTNCTMGQTVIRL